MVELKSLLVAAGPSTIGPVNLRMEKGSHVALMGRTGAGKTSVLEAIAGLRRVVGGSVVLDGRDVTGLRPADRGVGYVPQDLALFSTMTVRQHLSFGPELRGWDSWTIATRVAEMADLLRIAPLLDRRPAGLSGGEAQRTALGRALAFAPAILLLDEPLSALDDDTRGEMYDLLRDVRRRTGVTTLHVTHSTDEARRLADEIVRFEDLACPSVE
ncbi:MAG TPA: ABC transporter ATP-binding protein [Tepidisphaeraceae bacterium]|nr:ABC transporter ATP-binding protein [Tepidisphaeraceae bacterium]